MIATNHDPGLISLVLEQYISVPDVFLSMGNSNQPFYDSKPIMRDQKSATISMKVGSNSSNKSPVVDVVEGESSDSTDTIPTESPDSCIL